MADEYDGIDIKLSEEDSPADILRESEDISLFSDDHGIGEDSAAVADSIPESELQEVYNKLGALDKALIQAEKI